MATNQWELFIEVPRKHNVYEKQVIPGIVDINWLIRGARCSPHARLKCCHGNAFSALNCLQSHLSSELFNSIRVIMTEVDSLVKEAEMDECNGEQSDEAPKPESSETIAPKWKSNFELINFESSNALLYRLYVQGDYIGCKSLIGEMLEQSSNQSEYAFYMRGIIARVEGELEDALSWFKKALEISANSTTYLVNIGRVYFLMGNHTLAVEYLEKAVKGNPSDSKAYYWLARAVYHLDTDLFNTCEKARDLLLQAPSLQNSVELIVFLAKLMGELGDTTAAIQAYERALQLEPENLDVMFKMGMLYLRNNNEDPAFAMLGKALSYDSTHQQCILAAGSIMQAHGDHDVALNKYRVAADACDYNGCLWNNIAVCLFAKGRLAQAHSCLKKASFICPLDYKINYNLGLVHQAMGLHCSALHFLKAASELKRDDPQIIGAMAVVLSNMGDVNNARRAYQKSIGLDPKAQVILNYAIFEFRQKNRDIARDALTHFKTVSSNAGGCRKDLLSKADQLDDALLSLPQEEEQA
ncbi:hypothetical protein RB195_016626 [Necator americanus]|uniref:Tetratricopeptide repeat protein n=2 Tax=Necator americanus TaxID=51031 RepID=A0ABR1C1C0_NECAM